MFYAVLIMTAMGLFAAASAAAFAWAVFSGQFGELDAAAESIFWDDEPDGTVPRG